MLEKSTIICCNSKEEDPLGRWKWSGKEEDPQGGWRVKQWNNTLLPQRSKRKILICWTTKMWRRWVPWQANFYFNGGKDDYSANTSSHPTSESMVKQKDGDVNCSFINLAVYKLLPLAVRRSYLGVDRKHPSYPKLLYLYILNKHVKWPLWECVRRNGHI